VVIVARIRAPEAFGGTMQNVNVLLFDDFTALDALGPAEVLSRLKDHYAIRYFSVAGGGVRSSAGATVDTASIEEIEGPDILLVPGGFGTRELAKDLSFLYILRKLAEASSKVLCVCTGSALLAKTGILDLKKATSNKLAWNWATAQGENVDWVRRARWVADGKFYTSSGVTAGIDMALGFVADEIGIEAARRIADSMEYLWNEDRDVDLFAG
jgi:transcriptional regulator GlxA family with amidase domain